VKDKLPSKKPKEEKKKSGSFLKKLFRSSKTAKDGGLERHESQELASSDSGGASKTHLQSSMDLRSKTLDLVDFDMRAESTAQP
jgi:hypothetical protein